MSDHVASINLKKNKYKNGRDRNPSNSMHIWHPVDSYVSAVKSL